MIYIIAITSGLLTFLTLTHQRNRVLGLIDAGTFTLVDGLESISSTVTDIARFARRQLLSAVKEVGTGPRAVWKCTEACALVAVGFIFLRAEYNVLRLTLIALFAPTVVLADNSVGPAGGQDAVDLARYSAIVLVGLIVVFGHFLLTALGLGAKEARDMSPRRRFGLLSVSLISLGGVGAVVTALGLFRSEALGPNVDPNFETAYGALDVVGPALPLLFLIGGVVASWGLPQAVITIWIVLLAVFSLMTWPIARMLTIVVAIIDGGLSVILPEIIDFIAELGRRSWNTAARWGLTSSVIAPYGPRPRTRTALGRSAESMARKPDAGLIIADRWELVRGVPNADHGAFGTPWLARDIEGSHDPVVVKLINPGRVSGSDQRRRRRAFQRELLNTVISDHVVPLIDSGDDTDGSGFYYVVTPYYRNGSLRRYYEERKPLPTLDWCLNRTRDVLQGLIDCRGIIHHDIKPENILIDDEGRARINDFGLARRLRTGEYPTASMGLGTVFFTAPEQWQLSDGWATALCDVYSVGAVLYYLLSGRPPFEREMETEKISIQDVVSRLVCDPTRSPARLDSVDVRFAEHAALVELVDLVDRWLSYDAELRIPGVDPSHAIASAGTELDKVERNLGELARRFVVGN